jgi:hypothetical protein
MTIAQTLSRPPRRCRSAVTLRAMGEQVHATVVLAPGASLSEADVISYARRHPGGYKCPRSVSFTWRAPAHRIGQAAQAGTAAPYRAGHTKRVRAKPSAPRRESAEAAPGWPSGLARDHGISRVTAYWYLDEVITVLADPPPDLAEAQNRRHHQRRPRPHPLRAQLHHMKFVEITSMSRGI